jgi:outer membrane lipoprotein-sorting protein
MNNIFKNQLHSKKLAFVAFISLLVITSTTKIFAETKPDVQSIITKANLNAFYAGKDGRAESRMLIVDSNGRQQQRQFTMIRKTLEQGGDQNFLVVFDRPAELKRTSFLVKKHIKSDDDRWLYLPSLDLVKRISAGDKRTSFVGSDFFYEDISGRNLDEDTHELIETSDSHYLILNKPKDANNVEFSEYTVWINRQNFMPEKTEYKDKNGELYRRIEALEIQDVQGYPTATKIKVSDLKSDSYTLNEIRFVKYDLGIPESVFGERSIRNPPQQWLKRPEK